ncbi:MAG: hypothetical protein P8Y25_15765 [Chromatiaceae bacterium]
MAAAAGRGDPGLHGRRQGGRAARWRAGWTYLPETLADVTEILDLLHALASLCEAAHLFHPNGSGAARAFVKEEARRILHGEVAAVIHSQRWLATHHQLMGKRRETLERICGYFHNNAQRMAYDVYLEHGFFQPATRRVAGADDGLHPSRPGLAPGKTRQALLGAQKT